MKKLFTLTFLASFAVLHVFSTPDNPVHLMRSNLFVMGTGGDTTLLDGDLSQYDPTFTNAVDGMDARKMSNFSENIGMIRQATTLVIERRHTIEISDTNFYRIWNLSTSRNYQLQFSMTNMDQPGLAAYLEDLYLDTKTPVSLNGTTCANFGVTFDPASSNAYRFRLVFTSPVGGALPLTFVSQNAYPKGSAVKIDWNTASENNVNEYSVERSGDGKAFKSLGSVNADNLPANSYSLTDQFAAVGTNYYRIHSTSVDGNSRYSAIMKVVVEDGISVIKVFPNPIAGNTINLRLVNQPPGVYKIRLVSSFGQCVIAKEVSYAGGTGIQNLAIAPGMPHGVYQLEVIKPGSTRNNMSIIY